MSATTTEKSATSKNGKPPTDTTAKKVTDFKAPAGFVDQAQDVVGFYDIDTEAVIQFIPREATLMDGSIDAVKTSILIFGELVAPCKLMESSKSGNVIQAKAGEQVGVWAKPGMKALRNLAGVHVVMYPDGTKDVGKGNPMTVFKVLAKAKGAKLAGVEDRRDKSKGQETWLDKNIEGPTPF